MGFPKFLMSSAVLAGVVFCSTTVPLAALNSKTVTVQVNEQPVLMGQLQDFAPPYLGFATLLSLGTGIVSLSALGWRNSAKKLEETADKTKSLEQKLQEQSYLIENLKFSDRRLVAAGLDTFLADGEQTKTASDVTPANTVMTSDSGADVDTSLNLTSAELEQIASFVYGRTASGGEVSSVFKFPLVDAAQDVSPAVEETHPMVEPVEQPNHTEAKTESSQNDQEQLQLLMGQLQQMMNQVERLQVPQTPAQTAA